MIDEANEFIGLISWHIVANHINVFSSELFHEIFYHVYYGEYSSSLCMPFFFAIFSSDRLRT